MAAVWMRFRSELCARWRGWLVVALLAGVAGGLVLILVTLFGMTLAYPL